MILKTSEEANLLAQQFQGRDYLDVYEFNRGGWKNSFVLVSLTNIPPFLVFQIRINGKDNQLDKLTGKVQDIFVIHDSIEDKIEILNPDYFPDWRREGSIKIEFFHNNDDENRVNKYDGRIMRFK